MKQQNVTRAIAVTALFTSIAVILRSVGIMIPIAGAPAMRIAFDGVFYKMAGFMFGPFFGGASAGLADIMGYTLKPAGPYIPLFTITTIINGAIPAVIWNALKYKDSKTLEKAGFGTFGTIMVLGLINMLFYNYFPKSIITSVIMSIGKKATFATYGMLLVGLIGLVLMLITRAARKKTFDKYIYNSYFKLILAIGIPGIIVTILNTYLLKIYIPQLRGAGFLALLIPRIIENLMMLPIEAYIISILMGAYQKVFKRVIS